MDTLVDGPTLLQEPERDTIVELLDLAKKQVLGHEGQLIFSNDELTIKRPLEAVDEGMIVIPIYHEATRRWLSIEIDTLGRCYVGDYA